MSRECSVPRVWCPESVVSRGCLEGVPRASTERRLHCMTKRCKVAEFSEDFRRSLSDSTGISETRDVNILDPTPDSFPMPT